MKFRFLRLLLSFLNVPEIDLSEIKTPDFDILLLAFDDLMDKVCPTNHGFFELVLNPSGSEANWLSTLERDTTTN